MCLGVRQLSPSLHSGLSQPYGKSVWIPVCIGRASALRTKVLSGHWLGVGIAPMGRWDVLPTQASCLP